MVQVFSLEEYPRTAGMVAEPSSLVQRRGPTGVVLLQPVELVEEFLVATGLFVGRGDLLDHRHQGLGDISAAVHTEMATTVGIVVGRFGDGRAGTRQLRAHDVCHHERSTCKRLIRFDA